jgi:hypothetical protein
MSGFFNQRPVAVFILFANFSRIFGIDEIAALAPQTDLGRPVINTLK